MDVKSQMFSSLESLREDGLYRDPAVVESACGPIIRVDGRDVLCLCSNDYLSLASDIAIKSAVCEAVRKWGLGAGASRLVSGTSTEHVNLQRKLAKFKRTESALVTSTGWQANHAAIHALAGAGDMILSDKLNHASIIDASRASGARLCTYLHCDIAAAYKILQKKRAKYRRCLIVTDSLFSMDGDIAPLSELVDLKNRFDAILMIDEAHATGVLGSGGRGAAELLGVEDEIDIYVGTLSKAIGSLGGFVAGSMELIETIVNFSRAFIYTTALPPALCVAASAALDIIHDEPNRRETLLQNASRLAEKISSLTFGRAYNKNTPSISNTPVTQIIPVVIGPADKAVSISKALLEDGFFVPAIRPPTVARGTSRLRISLSSGHKRADLDKFADVLKGMSY